jgi:hypothetical protein
MRITFFNIAATVVIGLCVAAVAAIVWREVSRSEMGDERAAITADFVGRCQRLTPECVAMVDDATDWALAHGRVTQACLAHRPGHVAIARGAVIWLNAHAAMHPLLAEDGITRAAAAIWPCRQK